MKIRAINTIRVHQYFSLHEFQCPCCKTVKLHQRLLDRLANLRFALGSPVMITSGYRCKLYNRKVGGVPGSYHLEGMAADICSPGRSLYSIYEISMGIGFTGLGLYRDNDFVHLDIRPGAVLEWEG